METTNPRLIWVQTKLTYKNIRMPCLIFPANFQRSTLYQLTLPKYEVFRICMTGWYRWMVANLKLRTRKHKNHSFKDFNEVCVAQSLVFCVVFCRSLFVLLYIFFCALCSLFFFDLRILITPLVSSNSSLKSYLQNCIQSNYSCFYPSDANVYDSKLFKIFFSKNIYKLYISTLCQADHILSKQYKVWCIY